MNLEPQRFLPISEPDIGDLEIEYVNDAMRSGWVSSIGEYIDRFELEYCNFNSVAHSVSVSSGTAALEVSLKALGVGPGDEVLVPDLTFAAVPASVVNVGAEPVFVDIESSTWTIDPKAVERSLSEKTKAIIVVHSFGHPADMDKILSVCAERGIYVVEDCAEAHGATYRGRPVGSIGDVGTYSFYGNKILTTGEGGMVVTKNLELAERVRFLKDHAMDKKKRYFHPEVGFNFRMTNVQAAMGCAQLSRVDYLLRKRARLLDVYRELLDGTNLVINPAASWANPVNWLVSVTLDSSLHGAREALLAKLRMRGIDSRPFFYRLSDMPPYKKYRKIGATDPDTPIAKAVSEVGFCLPTSTKLSEDDVEIVCSSLKVALRD